jgi:hypothetical protein
VLQKQGGYVPVTPNIQGDAPGIRIKNLFSGVKEGEVLFYADFKYAEPTIIRHTLGLPINVDPYLWLANILGIERTEAKKELGRLHYSPALPSKLIKKYGLKESKGFEELASYAESLDELQERLYAEGKPCKKKRRFVETISGSIIEKNRQGRVHRGTMLNWYAQGSVADFINPACIRLIRLEKKLGWRFLFPVHDAVYLIGKPEHEKRLKGILQGTPKPYGVNMKVKIEKYLPKKSK